MPVHSQSLGKRSLLVLRFASCEARMDEGGLPEHRSEHQAPRRAGRTIIPDAVAEPPSERSVFGEPARCASAQGKLRTCPHGERSVFGEPARDVFS